MLPLVYQALFVLYLQSFAVSSLVRNQVTFERPAKQRPAALPVPNPTRSFWIDSAPDANPLATEGSEGPLTSEADVCIIGSGMTGASAAYHLANAIIGKNQKNSSKRPITGVILEARDFCSGATGRNGGHLTPVAFVGFQKWNELYGKEEALRSIAIENHTVSEILKIVANEGISEAVDVVNGGHVEMFLESHQLESAQTDFLAAKNAGVHLGEVEWLSEEEMQSTYGTFHHGVRFPGHTLWPLKFVTHLYNLAKSKTPHFSLTLHTRTPVISIAPISLNASISTSKAAIKRWVLGTPRGTVDCSYIIHATNAYASHLLPHLSGPDGIVPTRGQVLALRAAVSSVELTDASWVSAGFAYWFPRPVANPRKDHPLVIIGGGREPSAETYEEDDSVVNERVGRALRDYLPKEFHGKFEIGRKPEMEWTGIMGFTKTGDPFVGPVKGTHHEGQFISAGYTGHGMPRAFACGEAVADMVFADLNGKDWCRPEWLPKRYLTNQDSINI